MLLATKVLRLAKHMQSHSEQINHPDVELLLSKWARKQSKCLHSFSNENQGFFIVHIHNGNIVY